MARILVEEKEAPFGIMSHSMTNSSPQFAGKFFSTVNVTLDTRLMTTTAYYLQTIEQTERVKKNKYQSVLSFRQKALEQLAYVGKAAYIRLQRLDARDDKTDTS